MYRSEKDRHDRNRGHFKDKEYNSKRLWGHNWGPYAKTLTHRKERAEGRRLIINQIKNFLSSEE